MYREGTMLKKVKVRVCCGTACFVMGGSDLLTLDEYLLKEEMEKLDFEAVTCLDTCRKNDDEKPPFVTIDDKLYNRMNMTQLVSIIRDKLEKGG